MRKITSILLILAILSSMVLSLNSCGSNSDDFKASDDYKIIEKWSYTIISSKGSDFDKIYYIHLFRDGSYERGFKHGTSSSGFVDEVGTYEKTSEEIFLMPRGKTYRSIFTYNDNKTEIHSGNQTYYKQ